MRAKHPCAHFSCYTGIPATDKYCEAHASLHRDDHPRKHPEYQQMYNTSRWKKLRAWQLHQQPVCERCGKHFADTVHHKVEHDGYLEMFYAVDNLESLCRACHDKHHSKTGWGRRVMAS